MNARAAIPEATAKLILERFRVFRARTELRLGKLTLLAGANSSGKSSALLGALLLKQTLDAPFDPGPLRLSGGHASVASFDDLRTRGSHGPVVLGVETTDRQTMEISFDRGVDGEIAVVSMLSRGARGPAVRLEVGKRWAGREVARNRFLLGSSVQRRAGEVAVPWSASRAAQTIARILHVPGLRSPPERDYPVTAIGDPFEGRFDPYVASVLVAWQRSGDKRLAKTAGDLRALGLTWKVRARRKSDTHVAIEVGRLPRPQRGGANDVVELADVGVGVSQALPVIVALHQATRGQLVYVEQPELHLHPRAQRAMAAILVAAAARGVRVVVETHSSLLLLGIQTEIAAGDTLLSPSEVQLHWFARDPKTGDAHLTSRTLDENGAFADWPADFDDVELSAQADYLDTVEQNR